MSYLANYLDIDCVTCQSQMTVNVTISLKFIFKPHLQDMAFFSVGSSQEYPNYVLKTS